MNILTRLLRNIIHSISNRLSTIGKTESTTKIQNISKVLDYKIYRNQEIIHLALKSQFILTLSRLGFAKPK